MCIFNIYIYKGIQQNHLSLVAERLLMVGPLSQCSTTGVIKAFMYAILSMRKSSPCTGGSRFPLELSVWSFTICQMPYNRK